MLKKSVKLLALLLAIAVTASLSACGKAGTESGYDSDWEYTDSGEIVGDASGDSSDTSDASGSGSTSSGGNTASNTSSGGKTPTKKPSGDSKFLVDPEDYRGTTVTYVTWKDPKLNEDGPVIENFKKKYGINVNIQLVNQETYLTTISSNIAAGKQGDIFFENGTFPGSLNVMEPLDNAMINFDDPIWNQSTIKISTIAGHPYLVDTISNIWAEVDICVYNKNLFKQANLTTPEELYEAGQWTFDNMRKAAQAISALGKDYIGVEINSETALGAAGAHLFNYKNETISAGLDNHLKEVMTFLAQMKTDGLAALGHRAFNDGKVGIGLTNCFALKKNGYFTTINPEHVGVTYLPTWKAGEKTISTGIYRGWGLIKGAKNPVAAGIFLREYLDINNYDVDEAFLNDEVADFFFQVTGAAGNIDYYYGNAMVKATGTGTEYGDRWATIEPSQIGTYLDGELNVMKDMAKKANDIIASAKKYISENY